MLEVIDLHICPLLTLSNSITRQETGMVILDYGAFAERYAKNELYQEPVIVDMILCMKIENA